MIISEKLLNELQILNTDIENILITKSLTTFQLDTFFKNFEKRRYYRIFQMERMLQRPESGDHSSWQEGDGGSESGITSLPWNDFRKRFTTFRKGSDTGKRIWDRFG